MNKKILPLLVSTVVVLSPQAHAQESTFFDGKGYENLSPITITNGVQKEKTPLRGEIIQAKVSHKDIDVNHEDNTLFYTTGKAHVDKQLAPQQVQYGELDKLGRTTGVWAVITSDMFEHSLGGEDYPREYKNDPSGWVNTSNKDNYKDGFYHRTQLLGDALGGRLFEENIITGVSSLQDEAHDDKDPGGMHYVVNLVQDYFLNGGTTHVYYSAVPNYVKDELIPRTITVNIKSGDGKLDQQIIVDNITPGYTIDYKTGKFAQNGVKTGTKLGTKPYTKERTRPIVYEAQVDRTSSSAPSTTSTGSASGSESSNTSSSPTTTSENTLRVASSHDGGIIPQDASTETVIKRDGNELVITRENGNVVKSVVTFKDKSTSESTIPYDKIQGKPVEKYFVDKDKTDQIVNRLIAGEKLEDIVKSINTNPERTTSPSAQSSGTSSSSAPSSTSAAPTSNNTDSNGTDGQPGQPGQPGGTAQSNTTAHNNGVNVNTGGTAFTNLVSIFK